MTGSLTQCIHQAYRGDLAHSHVVAISQHHRIQASPGYRAAAGYVAEQLAAAGLEVATRSYPADGVAQFWTTPSFLEWECRGATLHLLDSAGVPIERLCDFAAIPTSLIQRSIAADGDFEVAILPGAGGSRPGDYDGADVTGKLILTDRPVAAVRQLAVRERGAAGILFDGMAAGGRSAYDLPDARQYTSFWWAGATPPDGWGFVLSPRVGRRLRDRLTQGERVRVRAMVNARFYPGAFEVVEACLPGADPSGQEVLLVSHLCHPKPGAHDNASGAAALIETAATLVRMLDLGELPPLRRGIRFIWPPEMTGTYAWLAEHEPDLMRGRWVAGLNLDMVGADQCATGGAWQLVDLPQAVASFADHLLAWLREPLLSGQRYEETPFSGGSDHYILSDPTVGVPAPMLIQWPDRFYHTSADTPDRVSPDSLERSGALAATYAAWLAMAGPAEARWLGSLMASRFTSSAGRDAVNTSAALREGQPEDRGRIAREFRRRSEFRADRMKAALSTLTRLDPDCGDEARALCARVDLAHTEALTAIEHDMGAHPQAGEPPSAAADGDAARLIPCRLARGPVDAAMAIQASAPDHLPELWSLAEEYGAGYPDDAALLQYWADGHRTVAEIAGLTALETGRACSAEMAVRFFRLLSATGYLALRETSSE